MTISEQLQFSVLTAPVAALDRRTLSQAWYSALYGGEKSKSSVTVLAHCVSKNFAPAHSAQPMPAGTRGSENGRRASIQVHDAKAPARAEGMAQDRRAPRSPLARKIERTFLRPRSISRRNAFTLEGEHGRVHVLLQSRGTHLKLVAICPPKACTQVAAALAQARYSLALRGIDIDAETREAERC
jgi:hypothetical protein